MVAVFFSELLKILKKCSSSVSFGDISNAQRRSSTPILKEQVVTNILITFSTLLIFWASPTLNVKGTSSEHAVINILITN